MQCCPCLTHSCPFQFDFAVRPAPILFTALLLLKMHPSSEFHDMFKKTCIFEYLIFMLLYYENSTLGVIMSLVILKYSSGL